MPSLSPKRGVTYSQADLTAIEATATLLKFMNDYDLKAVKECNTAATLMAVRDVIKYIVKEREPKPPTAKPAEKKPAN